MIEPEELLGLAELFEDLQASPRTQQWSLHLMGKLKTAFDPGSNGNLRGWLECIAELPEMGPEGVDWAASRVSCSGPHTQGEKLQKALLGLHPWRKGPFQLFDIHIDTEWRSDLKWERIAPHIDLQDSDILDVGCGNGYYAYRMRAQGARRVVGLDPYLLYLVQFGALRKYLGSERIYLLPAGDTDIPVNLRLFDHVFSMGVLYHRKSPIEHLQLLFHALKQGGELVLETLVIEGGEQEVLIPEDRYAQMKNVWFLPSCGLLKRMITKCGFVEPELLDLTATTHEEQRRTEWMRFDSLPQFLDPQDSNRTIEGYPAPLRATLKARRP